MKTLASISALSLLPLIAFAAPIPGIFSTGVDDEGVPLADNLVDPHYVFIANAHDGGSDALAMGAIPSPPWVANSATSRWIGPTPNSDGAPGLYTFRLTFDLTGFDESSARISGSWSSDNGAPAMRLNGVDTGLSHPGNFDTLIDFELISDFLPGVNTLEFDVMNAGETPNPVGLRVDMVGTVEVPGEAPSILTQPAGVQVFDGEAFDLNAVADGAAPLSYQWQLDGADIPGATSATYNVAASGQSDAGDYTVVVSNAFGTAVSDPPATVIIVHPIGGLFPTGVDDFGVLLPDGEIDPHYQISVNAHEESPDAIVQNTVGFPIGTGPWVPSGPNSKWIGPTFDTNGAEGDYTFRATIDLDGFDPATAFVHGRWSTDNSGVDILVNGVSTGNTNGGFGGFSDFTLNQGSFIRGINTIDFIVNNAPASNNPIGFRVDEISGGALLGEAASELIILRQPDDQLVEIGAAASFSVLADGAQPLSYQWRFNGADLGGAIGPDLFIFNVSEASAGDYDVVVTNAEGSLTSDPATLTILRRPPEIPTPPADLFGVRGEELTFSVVADGTMPLSYQWRFNGTDIPGATAPDHVIPSPSSADVGDYDVVITNSDGVTTSAVATLTLLNRVPGIFNTGVDEDGIPLADNLADPHYDLVANIHDGGTSAFAMGAIPSPPWVPNSATSRWSGPTFDSNGAPGLYTFRTTFDLLGFDPATVILFGEWSSDNGITELRLNGVATGLTHGGDFTTLADFRLIDGFVAGINTLEFDVTNAGATPNPIGLRIENLNVLGVSADVHQFVVSSDDGGANLSFQWNSFASQVYSVVSTDDPVNNPDPATWPVVPGLENLAATLPLNQHIAPNPGEPLRLYRLLAGPVPPLLSDDFEAGAGDWTAVVNDPNNNTRWELGTPAGTTGPLAGADGSANAWCTNLGDYGPTSDISLQSPAIDLTAVPGAELTFDAFRDADGLNDTAEVRFLRAADLVQLGASVPIDMSLLDTDYVTLSIPVVPEALGENIIIEFNFVSDGSPDDFSGLSLDNVVVEVN